jgi:hypothetical protein
VTAQQPPYPYEIEQHMHLFAAWAASRAASVKGCRFSVEQGRTILEACGLTASYSSCEDLPKPKHVDEAHAEWRTLAISSASAKGIHFTHGVAAKLINVYLKSRFVCAGYHLHPNVCALHPPIDKLLLDDLADRNFGGQASRWRKTSREGWSKLSSSGYQDLILEIRGQLAGKPLWKIEEFWKGNQ